VKGLARHCLRIVLGTVEQHLPTLSAPSRGDATRRAIPQLTSRESETRVQPRRGGYEQKHGCAGQLRNACNLS